MSPCGSSAFERVRASVLRVYINELDVGLQKHSLQMSHKVMFRCICGTPSAIYYS